MVPCLVTLTDLKTRRAVCQHQLSFLFHLFCFQLLSILVKSWCRKSELRFDLIEN